ncbi:MAG TPA: hypothetical protein VL172_01010, partial [Kofleriaceae bacterium]|nr:hypothetical protein [Kofleriaceae bacterium]
APPAPTRMRGDEAKMGKRETRRATGSYQMKPAAPIMPTPRPPPPVPTMDDAPAQPTMDGDELAKAPRRIVIARGKVTGPADADAIDAVFHGGMSGFSACWQRSGQKGPLQVDFKIVIDKSGAIVYAKVNGAGRVLEACLTRIVRGMKFPAGTEASMSYSIHFPE